jgi:UDP-N-acetylmuramoyl-tripeptide--D-alanyl-D-alanine ligase
MKRFVQSLLARAARAYLARVNPKVAMVAGSAGKTTAKDGIAAAFAAAGAGRVRASEKSLNSELGLPLAVLGLPSGWKNPFAWLAILARAAWRARRGEAFDWLVLETGVDRPGDMDAILAIVRPDIAIVTLLPDQPVHAENFPNGTADEVAEEELKLAKGLKPGGILVGNADDGRVRASLGALGGTMVWYGFSPEAEVRATAKLPRYAGDGRPEGFALTLEWPGGGASVDVAGTVSVGRAYAVLAAAAACRAAELSPEVGARAAAAGHEEPGRGRILRGVRGSTVIDDSYNSSPAALRASLREVAAIKAPGRRVAVIGDMRELGPATSAAHEGVGRYAAELGFAAVAAVGGEARRVAVAAREAGCREVREFGRAEDAAAWLASWVESGDIVLVKGSQGVRLERVSAALLENPKDRALLPRQSAAWARR